MPVNNLAPFALPIERNAVCVLRRRGIDATKLSFSENVLELVKDLRGDELRNKLEELLTVKPKK